MYEVNVHCIFEVKQCSPRIVHGWVIAWVGAFFIISDAISKQGRLGTHEDKMSIKKVQKNKKQIYSEYKKV